MKKSKVLSLLTAGAMCMAMLPMSAFAATPGAPTVTSATIAGATSTTDDNGNLYLTVPSDTMLANQSFGLTTSEPVDFVVSDPDTVAMGALYASGADTNSATLNFNIDASDYVEGGIDFTTPAYTLNIASTDRTQWMGTFNEGFNMTMGTLASALHTVAARVQGGIMVDDNDTPNDAIRVYSNTDAASSYLIFAPAETASVSVTYNYDGGSYLWTVPSGSLLQEIVVPANDDVTGWYDESGEAVTFNTPVTENTVIYAETEDVPVESDFLTQLNSGAATIYINNEDDWEAFTENSALVPAGKVVELTVDINCGGKSYPSMTFAANFDGGNHTISNATFTPVDGNCGMFAVIGANQTVANVTLQNISSGSLMNTYSGILAGQVSGNNEVSRENCLVQNVHVIGGSVNGRTAAAVAGYSFGSTIRYCSSEGTSVSGLANGAGIVGLTYGTVDTCYSTVEPFGLQARGRGGIAGKLLQSGSIVDCWYTYDEIYGEDDLPGEVDGNFPLDRSLEPVAQYQAAYGWADNNPDTQPDWTTGYKGTEVFINYAVDTTYNFD